MNSVTFVVLHYIVLEDTIECVESIRRMKYPNMDVIIVDNCSPNGSGALLKEMYDKDINITTIVNDTNLGFTLGNNVGFRFAKYRLESDFIVMVNNDIVFNETEFAEGIINEFYNSTYDVLGPDIISANGIHQNPEMREPLSEAQVKKLVRKTLILLILNYLKIDIYTERFYTSVKFLLKSISSFSRKNIFEPMPNVCVKQENVQLHGSCLVFSPSYVSKYDGLFPKKAFYMEEDILMFLSEKNGLKTLYYPFLSVHHKEDGATNAIFKKDVLKRRFKYKNVLESGRLLLELMRGNLPISRW